SALRLGASKVTILYRRTKELMPAHPFEVEAAVAEGVEIVALASLVRINGSGSVTGLTCIRMQPGVRGKSNEGPRPVPDSEFEVGADMVIAAIGQSVDNIGLSALFAGGRILVDPETLETGRRGVFAGGDAVTGPRTAIEAIAAGKRAAVSIDRYLRSAGLPEGRAPSRPDAPPAGVPSQVERSNLKPYLDIPTPRTPMPELPVPARISSFEEVELGFSEEAARAEARRCLGCRACLGCGLCQVVCKPGAIDFGPVPGVSNLSPKYSTGGRCLVVPNSS
ncbi:MAG: FAD-dependent oxidoreductase, partial [Chloroflexi bacterium]|nr:FAD-dependent oxidoreductase [Chloroflexota bacterium]